MGGTGALSTLAASSVPERRRGHAKTTARGISVRRIVRFCPVSTAPDPAHRALGRGRRHRCDGAHHRKPAGEGAQAAGERGEPHRRLGRGRPPGDRVLDRKSTRLNSSHITISYAVFCLKKKKKHHSTPHPHPPPPPTHAR